MAQQNYSHHKRYYPPHHFIFYPLLSVATGFSAWQLFHDQSNRLLWIAVTGLFMALIWLSYMIRQHYALMNQNRIVRLEMRYRYFVLTHRPFEVQESHLHFKQIAALRFASDEELPELVEKAVRENLSPDQIKRQIRHWVPDTMRV